jgi:transcriptional regulator GlxA family with amidase domain
MIGERLCECVTAGLLLAVDHQYRDELLCPGPSTRPRTVKRAIDAMEADPAHHFTVTELAQAAEVSARALQDGFRRHLDMSPMMYLRQLRLVRVHDELRRADPGRVTVADIAHRWGFTHLGRFAGTYRAKYGVPPSATMRSTR